MAIFLSHVCTGFALNSLRPRDAYVRRLFNHLAHPQFRLRPNKVSTRWVYGMFLFHPYLKARLWVSHRNTIYHTEYAMNAKIQQQAITCVWAWISNKNNTLNKCKHWNLCIYKLTAAWLRHMATQIWVKIGLCYGWLLDGTKPLAKPMDGLKSRLAQVITGDGYVCTFLTNLCQGNVYLKRDFLYTPNADNS